MFDNLIIKVQKSVNYFDFSDNSFKAGPITENRRRISAYFYRIAPGLHARVLVSGNIALAVLR